MQITLVRHTAVSPEWQVICYGNTDIPLADTFDEEAPRVAAQIDPSLYDRILSSPLSRALKLAQHCVPQGTHIIEVDDRLKEINFGDWEGKHWDSILEKEQEVSAFFEYFIDQPAPRGESLRDLARRVADLLDELYTSGAQRVLLFSHGGVINAVRAMAGRITLQEAFAQILPYGSVTTIDLDELIHIDPIKL